MKRKYQISIEQLSAQHKIHRENFDSDKAYDDAIAEAKDKIFYRIDLIDVDEIKGDTRMGLHSPIFQDSDWKHGFRVALEAVRIAILKHEGIPQIEVHKIK